MPTICAITRRANEIELCDDGTLDTVLGCNQCNRTRRYSFDDDGQGAADYDEFILWAVEDFAHDHAQW